MTRLIVAGLGAIGARHARIVAEARGLSLAAVVDPDPTRRAGFDAPGFDDLEQVDVAADGAVLATPSQLHADHVELALSRGWAALVEKPVAGTLADADRIVTAAARAGAPQVLVGHHRRHHARLQKARELLRDGAIGQPVLASSIWSVRKPDGYFDVPWRQGPDGAPVRMNVIHEVDALRFLLGEVAEVAALGAQPVHGRGWVESGAVALRFASGVCASVVFADTTPSPWGFEAGTGENPNIAHSGQDSLRITGAMGALSFPSLTLWTGAPDWGTAPTARTVEAPATDPLAAQLEHFAEVIAGRATPICTAEDGRETLAVTARVEAAIDASMETAA